MNRIPPQIRLEIFELFLQSFSLHDIACMIKVSVGTVKNVIDEFIETELDYKEIRKIFENIRKNGFEPNKIILALRLINNITKTELTLETLLAFIDSAETERFRLNIDINYFISRISSLLFFEIEQGIRIEDYKNYIDEKKEEIEMLEIKYNDLLKKKSIIESDLSEYNKDRKEIKEFINLKNKKKLPKEFEWISHEYNYTEASEILKQNIDPGFLYSCLNRIYLEPEKYTDIIKIISNRFRSNTNTNKNFCDNGYGFTTI